MKVVTHSTISDYNLHSMRLDAVTYFNRLYANVKIISRVNVYDYFTMSYRTVVNWELEPSCTEASSLHNRGLNYVFY